MYRTDMFYYDWFLFLLKIPQKLGIYVCRQPLHCNDDKQSNLQRDEHMQHDEFY